MNIGIVGSEAAKFTPVTEASAREYIQCMLFDLQHLHPHVTVVSGGCHLGGVDIFAEEEAAKQGLKTIVHLPAKRSWEGGYKQRNLAIARDSDACLCITIAEYPEFYKGMTFKGCYHCGNTIPPHIKSGGCWTVRQAGKLGKPMLWCIIQPDGTRVTWQS